MKLKESAEDYLEAILILQLRNGAVRSIDVAREMDFSKPSVSNAMKRLRQGGYIETDDDGFISLTATGRRTAEHIYERHCMIAQFLMALGVEEKTAFEDACKMEHVLSEESFSRMKAHYCAKKS